MRLVYENTGKEVQLGDIVEVHGEKLRVDFFRIPDHPSSSGKVYVKQLTGADAMGMEYFVSVIGAKWIEREDRDQGVDTWFVHQKIQPAFFGNVEIKDRTQFLIDYDCVAMVKTAGGKDEVFKLTNHIEEAWYDNNEVTRMFKGDGCRSTSVGDIIEHKETGKHYLCASIGWEELPQLKKQEEKV